MNRTLKRIGVVFFSFCICVFILTSNSTIGLTCSILGNYQNAVGIDLSFSTYYGGSNNDGLIDMVIDSEDNIIIIGYTSSTNFPVVNAFQENSEGSDDSFVVKLDPSGQNILFASYLGGNGNDLAVKVTIDSSDNIYVTGITYSTNFPVSNAIQGTKNGVSDGFITKINPTGEVLYSTFLGGSGNDFAYGMDVDSEDHLIVSGHTASNDFITTTDAFDSSFGGGEDCFITILSADGQTVEYSSYLGGSAVDMGICGLVNQNNEIVIAGLTYSTNFNTTVDAYQSSNAGSEDVFISIFNATGQELLYSSYFGGNGDEIAADITEDSFGNLIVAGRTTATNLPLGLTPIRNHYSGGEDAFVVKFNTKDNSLNFSSYLGGIGYDFANGLAIDEEDNIIISGTTSSSSFNVTANAYQSLIGGGKDLFLTILPPNGTSLLYSTFLGGAYNDEGKKVAFDAENNIILTGLSISTNFPITNAFQSSLAGNNDAFICKFTFSNETRKISLSELDAILYSTIVCSFAIIIHKRKQLNEKH
ncbi:MAG: SBBP repeat-containing protein [Candidatus Thorarchaeota archaeon]